MYKKIFCVAVVVLGLVAVAVTLGQGNTSDKIPRNTYIHGIAVGGLRPIEAEAALMAHFQPILDTQEIQFTLKGEAKGTFPFTAFGARLDFAHLVATAQNRRVLPLIGRSHHISEQPPLVVVPEQAQSVFAGLARDINIAPHNATFFMEDGKIIVSPEKAGQAIDLPLLATGTEQVLNTHTSGVVDIATHVVAPTYTKADFAFPVSVLGSFRTRYRDDDSAPRIHNVALASSRIHNQVLFPGEVFSAGGAIGAHLPNSGYQSAIVLVRGEPVEDIGGGVCQVVSTLYNAALVAELPILQRHNHSAPVSYVEKGFDATVAGDYLDLKFKNDTSHPILIVSLMKEGELHITIHGLESRPPGRTIRFAAQRTQVTQPEGYREILDTALARGQRHILLESQMGYTVELHKHVYIDGVEVETVKINTSIYKPLQGIVAIGAG